MEKHNLYYRILESLGGGECPVCSYLAKSAEKYFDDLLYEGVTDPGFVRKFRGNRGFCNAHAYKLLSYKDGLAVARLYSYLSRDSLGSFAGAAGAERRAAGRCPACESQKSTESVVAGAFREYLEDAEFRDAFLGSDGLCHHHYLRVARLFGKDVPSWFVDFQFSRLQELSRKIDALLDFGNYSLGGKKPDLGYEDQLVYQKAVRFFSGFEGMVAVPPGKAHRE